MNDVASNDLKKFKKSGSKEIAILYMHYEFSKLIKGKVIENKKPDTIIKALESKWIVGGALAQATQAEVWDNAGEFLNPDLVDFAAALDISI